MANIRRPKKFDEKLNGNDKLTSVVTDVLSRFGEILKTNDLFFFPEYTDHGIEHIESVLAASANLIRDETYEILSAEDISYYILSVILHDIGMHIGIDGLNSLLQGEFDNVRIKELDPYTWKELWEDYLSEAKRFNGKQLHSIFGDENTIVEIPDFSKPGKINLENRLLAGEFIRRHHARLAHEVAIKGFPGKPHILTFSNELDDKRRNLIGLISRSHGTDLRKCLDYIEKAYGNKARRFPLSIHATFLMVVLRLADYIQIDRSRTSIELLKIKRLSSPISIKEHKAHLAIDSIDNDYQDDPERIYVSASPVDSEMYLKLKKLFKEIQREFDLSWAVLGELYGRIDEKPEIKYRRITSNIEDDKFISNQKYLADTFSFKANDEIMKLLIAPLYGDDPKFGVRELLQNAVDACREREEFELIKGGDYKGEIIVDIFEEPDGQFFFQITDNGIGMDMNVIKNYFLSVGSSFRKSADWQKSFINESGDSKVRRSGRFGVGILAAFLIGHEISVETKKINSSVGYVFSTDLNKEQINILRKEGLENGTTIRIKIRDSALEQFSPIDEEEKEEAYDQRKYLEWFQWFTIPHPNITYTYFGKKLTPYNKLDPDISHIPDKWNSTDSDGYNKILWTYSNKYTDRMFTCNGFVIPIPEREYSIKQIYRLPHISVFDNNGMLPLSLNRNTISAYPSFSEDLAHDIFLDWIAKLLTMRTPSYADNTSIYFLDNDVNHDAFKIYYYPQLSFGKRNYNEKSKISQWILSSKKGFTINYNYFLKKTGEIRVLFFDSYVKQNLTKIDLDIQNHFFCFTRTGIRSYSDHQRAMYIYRDKFEETFTPIKSRFYVKKEKYDVLFGSTANSIDPLLQKRIKVEYSTDNWVCLKIGNPSKSLISNSLLEKYHKKINLIREDVFECTINDNPVLDKLLQRYIGDNVIIPYDIIERKAKYPLAFKELERYMRKYLKS